MVGIVNKTGSVADLEDMMARGKRLQNTFFLDVLVGAINRLPVTTRTRRNNLTQQIARCKLLPDYFRIFVEDLDVLSASVLNTFRSIPEDAPYRFYFTFFKFGQQIQISPPLTLQSCNLSSVINKVRKVQSCSLHIATNFSHDSSNFSTSWNLRKQSDLYLGADVKKYPFFGLSEVGNVTVMKPTSDMLLDPWLPSSRDTMSLNYVQFYTPFTKSLSSMPFIDHQFLLTLMLGKEYVKNNKTFDRSSISAYIDAWEGVCEEQQNF